jgi:Rrf2 family protein
MKLSSHEEYGLRCLLQVGRQGSYGSATIPEISQKEGLSTPYVAKLMRMLRRGGLVKAARGKVGGYTLALPPERIWIADALTILGGRMYEDDFCERHSGAQTSCAHSTGCSIRSLWRDLQGAIDSVLRTTTLQDLLGSGHSASISTASVPSDLVPLRNRPTRGPARPVSK